LLAEVIQPTILAKQSNEGVDVFLFIAKVSDGKLAFALDAEQLKTILYIMASTIMQWHSRSV